MHNGDQHIGGPAHGHNHCPEEAVRPERLKQNAPTAEALSRVGACLLDVATANDQPSQKHQPQQSSQTHDEDDSWLG